MKILIVLVSLVNLLFVPFAAIMLFSDSELNSSITLVDKVYSGLVLFQGVLVMLASKYVTEKIKYKLMFLLVVYEIVLVVHFKLLILIGDILCQFL